MAEAFPINSQIEQVVFDRTRSGYAEWAVETYRRLGHELEGLAEPVDFGDVALDVGSREGQYISAIRAHGPTTVVAVEPNPGDMRAGIRHGMINPEQAFGGTVGEWVQAGHEPADSAFVFNMYPRVAREPAFWKDVADAVKVGGVVVASFAENLSHYNFTTNLVPSLGAIGLQPIPHSEGHPPEVYETPRHRHFVFLRRIERV